MFHIQMHSKKNVHAAQTHKYNLVKPESMTMDFMMYIYKNIKKNY